MEAMLISNKPKTHHKFISLALLGPILATSVWLSLKYMHAMPPPESDSEQYFVVAYNMAKYGVSSASTDDQPGVRPSFREPIPSLLLSLPLRAMNLDRYKLSCFLGE